VGALLGVQERGGGSRGTATAAVAAAQVPQFVYVASCPRQFPSTSFQLHAALNI